MTPKRFLLPGYRAAWCLLASLCSLATLVPDLAGATTSRERARAISLSPTAIAVEIRRQGGVAGLSRADAQAIAAEIERTGLDRIREFAANPSAAGLERLLPGMVQRDRLPGNVLDRNATPGGSGSAQAVKGQLEGRGGFRDSRGHASESETQSDADNRARQFNEEIKREYEARGGGKSGSTQYQGGQRGDGSAANDLSLMVVATWAAWKTVYGSGSNAPPDSTPNPESSRPSGKVTAKDVKGALGRRGFDTTPTGDEEVTSGSGGLSPVRSDPLGTRGTFTEVGTVPTLTEAEADETIRVRTEKLQGPKAGAR